jgi:hypothetical protein
MVSDAFWPAAEGGVEGAPTNRTATYIAIIATCNLTGAPSERTFAFSEQPNATADRLGRLAKETERLMRELARLSAALASGADLPSVLAAIREREARRAMISAELATLDTTGSALVAWDAALPELHRRLTD